MTPGDRSLPGPRPLHRRQQRLGVDRTPVPEGVGRDRQGVRHRDRVLRDRRPPGPGRKVAGSRQNSHPDGAETTHRTRKALLEAGSVGTRSTDSTEASRRTRNRIPSCTASPPSLKPSAWNRCAPRCLRANRWRPTTARLVCPSSTTLSRCCEVAWRSWGGWGVGWGRAELWDQGVRQSRRDEMPPAPEARRTYRSSAVTNTPQRQSATAW